MFFPSNFHCITKICTARVWSLSYSVVGVLGSLFSKMYAIHKMFNDPNSEKVEIPERKLFKVGV